MESLVASFVRFIFVRFRSALRCLGAVPAGLLLFAATQSLGEQPSGADYTRDIRPILSAACYRCHGPSDSDRQAELRLDVEEEAVGPRKSGASIVPGDAGQSELFRRISSTDPDYRMPPAEAERQLSEDEIDKLRSWIEQGAAWKDHWSFVPLQRPELPATNNSVWARNEIDHFVLKRL
ncbi:MAG: hypothetical protein N2C12_06790 [Planctomycetales bacterium]